MRELNEVIIQHDAFNLPFDEEYDVLFDDYIELNDVKEYYLNMPSLIENLHDWLIGFSQTRTYKLIPNKNKVYDTNVLIMKIASQAIITENFINTRINNEDWLEDISDFIEYNIFSFGKNTVGAMLYGVLIKSLTEDNNYRIIPDQKKRIINHFHNNTYFICNDQRSKLQSLRSIYEKWLNVFPFNISVFIKLKNHYKRFIPVFIEDRKNRYTKLIKISLVSEKDLKKHLLFLTNDLLNSINIPELIKNGSISNLNSERLIISNESLKVKTSKLLNDFSKKELKYVDVIDEWLLFHKDYFKEISLLFENKKQIENSECEPKTTNSQKVLMSLNEYGFNKLVKLNEIDLNQLVEHIFGNALPYQIAYLNFLGFIKYVNDNYCKSQKELHKTLSKVLGANERAIRGNLNGLKNEKSADRKRYTAYQHTNSVEKHYQTLK